MNKSICCTPDCGQEVFTRGYCRGCYQRGRRTGEIPLLVATPRHSLKDVDIDKATATCSICGPTPISIRGKKRECMTVRRRTNVYRRPAGVEPRNRNTYPEPLTNQDYRLRREYGITSAEYENLSEEQEGRCLICRSRPDRLVVDHCHDAGHVRGLLCTQCNIGLGMFKDNPSFLANAIAYLRA